MKTHLLSWNDKFTLINKYQPDDQTICKVFNLSQSELQTAKQLHTLGMFQINKQLDTAKYGDLFTTQVPIFVDTTPNHIKDNTQHSISPETATKRTKLPKIPQKRGRKGDKILNAFLAVTSEPQDAEEFAKQHGVSLAVLRQSKRFIETMSDEHKSQIGKIFVKQDKTTKTLNIWREDVQ